MSASPCPHCGEPIALFGSGGGAETAKRLGALVGSDVPLLAEIPFDMHLRDGGDNGVPAYLGKENTLLKKTFDELLAALMATRPSLLGVPLALHT